MAERPVLTFKANSETLRAVEEYQDATDCESRSEAIEKLVEIGLREARYPILTRWREAALQASFYAAVSAVVFAILGLSPGVLAPVVGGQIAAVLLTLSASIVAATELARVAYSGDGLAARIRGENA